jgi:hypothetical protein
LEEDYPTYLSGQVNLYQNLTLTTTTVNQSQQIDNSVNDSFNDNSVNDSFNTVGNRTDSTVTVALCAHMPGQ